jgi:hypothetical protein
MHNLELAVSLGMMSDLVQVAATWQIQRNIRRDFEECIVKRLQVVWLHSAQVKDLSVLVVDSAPWRTGEDDDLLCTALKPLRNKIEAVTLQEHDLAFNAIDLGIMTSALQRQGVLLHVEDLLPSLRQSKGNCVATSTAKSIDQNGLLGRCDLSEMFSNLATSH